MRKAFYIFLLLAFPLISHAAVEYTISVEGIDNKQLLTIIEKASDLYSLSASPPATKTALKRRAEYDLPNIMKALHSQALYNARVKFEYNFISKPAQITIAVEPGEPYPLSQVQLVPVTKTSSPVLDQLTLEDIDFCLPVTATPKTIRHIETRLIKLLDERGYPYAKITEDEVIADQSTQMVSIRVHIDTGPQMKFGCTTVEGNCLVHNSYIEKKIFWCAGDIYSPRKIACTRRALETSHLFDGVDIIYPETPPEDGILPVTILLKESKFRSIGFGASYMTQKGPGILGSWENRNLGGKGDILNMRASIWNEEYYGKVSLTQPEFPSWHDAVVWSGEVSREETKGYTADYATLSTTFQRNYGDCADVSFSLMYKHLKDSNIHEGAGQEPQKSTKEEFDLLKIPFIFHWHCVDDTLNPTTGFNIHLNTTPSYQFLGNEFTYITNTLTTSAFIRLSKRLEQVLAFRIILGSIAGAAKEKIPRSELFDAGTDTLLRGYRYKTVSPLDSDNEPTGGRSLFIITTEFRSRLSQDFGFAIFHDMGNVYANSFPQLDQKVLNSVGLGLRYFTVVAPIRLDIAFPLNFRTSIDRSHYQVYFSIGQSF